MNLPYDGKQTSTRSSTDKENLVGCATAAIKNCTRSSTDRVGACGALDDSSILSGCTRRNQTLLFVSQSLRFGNYRKFVPPLKIALQFCKEQNIGTGC